MCGRFTLTLDPEALVAQFELSGIPQNYFPRFNIAPGQPVLVLRNAEDRRLEWLRWGLIPSWAKDPAIANRLINARAETVFEKPSFRASFRQRRCLIAADGFYEWLKTPGKASQPYYLTRSRHDGFYFAGLWDRWMDPNGNETCTCTLLTTTANSLVQSIHDRMPVMLTGGDAHMWMTATSQVELMALLHPFPAEQMSATPVSTDVNRVEADRPELILPISPGKAGQG